MQVALLVPNFDTLRKYMEANELAWEGPEEAIKSERVRQAIRASITHAANEHKVLAHVVAFGWRSDLVCAFHACRSRATRYHRPFTLSLRPFRRSWAS
jgi:hypothetical protein